MEQVLRKTNTAPEFQDGIYFDLDEQPYHLDAALGSTDMGKLRDNPCDYWWGSPMNPTRPIDKDTPARLRGRAMHKLVLEGEVTFDALYMRGPDHAEDMSPAEKSAATKAVNAEAKKIRKDVLPADTYDRVVMASAMITKNPKLATAF